jgi:proline iminopeptidase
MNGQIVSDGFTLQYRLSGTGIPTLVVGSSIYYDRSFSQELRTKLHMVFIDHRGFAPANYCQDTDKYQLDLLVDDIELMRRELGFDRVVIIGHSGHAFMALEYAKKYPDRKAALAANLVRLPSDAAILASDPSDR